MSATRSLAVTPEAVREEMQLRMEELCAPLRGRGVLEAVRVIARKLGVSFSTAKRLRYGEIATIPAHVADRVRMLAEDEACRRELAAVDALLARLDGGSLDALGSGALARLADVAAAAAAVPRRASGPMGPPAPRVVRRR